MGVSVGVGAGVGLGVGLPLGLAIFGSGAVAIAFPVATFGLTYMGMREAYRRLVRRRRRILDELFERLVQEAEAEIHRATLNDP